MKKNLSFLQMPVLSFLVLGLLLAGATSAAASPKGTVVLAINPSSKTVNVGDDFNLTVEVQAGTQQVDAAAAYLNFDKAKLQVVSLTSGTTLSTELEKSYDNTAGTINYAAGKLGTPFPSGTFTLVTISFHALAATAGTPLSFNSTMPRQSDVTFGGASILGSTVAGTVIVSNAGTTVLAVNPASKTVNVGDSFDLSVEVRAGAQPVDAAAAYLNFDPAKLEVVSLTGGTTLPTELEKTYDNSAGTINYAAGKLGGPYPSGTFTVLTATFHAKTATTGTTVSFNSTVPRQSDVTFAGASVLGSTIPGSVIVQNACYPLTMNVIPAGTGTVSVDPAPNCPTDSSKYLSGTVVCLTAMPSSGYGFINWSGDASGTSNPTCVTIGPGKYIVANFGSLPGPFHKISPPDGAIVQPPNVILSWTASAGATSYEYCGEQIGVISLHCDPVEGQWTSTTSTGGALSSLTGVITYRWQVRARNSAGITYADGGQWWNFTTQGPCSPPASINPPPGATLPWDVDLTFQWNSSACATQYLIEWWGGPYTPMQPCSWTSSTSCHIGQVWPGHTYSWHLKVRNAQGESNWSSTWSFTVQSRPCYALTTNVDPSGSGTVGRDPAPNCEGDNTKYAAGTQVQLTASTGGAYPFAYWSGDATGSSNPTAIVMDRDKNVVAHFANGNVTIASVWTTDGNDQAKSAFKRGDSIKYYGDVYNSTGTTQTAYFDWEVSGPCGLISSWKGNLDTSPGHAWWNLPTSVPTNACAGSYTYQLSVTYNSSTSSKSTTFGVDVVPPGAFNKLSPPNGAVSQPLTVTLSWQVSARATRYEYCYDTDNNNKCDGNWVSVSGTSATTPPLKPGTPYYWQVNAINAAGNRMANSGAWWSFRTKNVPGAFTKTSPGNASNGQSINPVLTWGGSGGAESYEYCYDTINNGTCDSTWTNVGTLRKAPLGPLTRGTTYYWQVRARNSVGIRQANAGVWWSFTIVENLLKNGSFEIDANGDGRPDSWSQNAKFTRSALLARDGNYAGRFKATDNTGATVNQTISGIKAGKIYCFSGWIDIPDTADVFSFKLQMRWRNSTGGVISTALIQNYVGPTADWQPITANLKAPAGATSAQLVMVATSLNAEIYVDDFELWY